MRYEFPRDHRLGLWLRADTLALADGDAVATWMDSSGSGRDASQSTAIDQPTYHPAALVGLPVVRFDGTNDSVLAASAMILKPCTIAYVLKPTDFAIQRSLLGGIAGGGGLALDVNATAGTVRILSESTVLLGTSTGALATGVTQILVVTYSSTGDWSFRIAGAAAGAGNSNTSILSLIPRIGNSNGGSQPFYGDIAEFLIYGSVLSPSDIGHVEDYLGVKYRIARRSPSVAFRFRPPPRRGIGLPPISTPTASPAALLACL